MSAAAEADKLVKGIQAWTRKAVAEVKNNMRAQGVRHRDGSRSDGDSVNKVKGRTKVRFGMPEKTSIVVPRHIVLGVEKGVGKGRKIRSGKETPKPSINPALEMLMSELEQVLDKHYPDIILKRIFVR